MRQIDTLVYESSVLSEASLVLTVLAERARAGRLYHAKTLVADFVAGAAIAEVDAAAARSHAPNFLPGSNEATAYEGAPMNRFADRVVFGFPEPLDVLRAKLVIAPVFKTSDRLAWTTSVEAVPEGGLLNAFCGIRYYRALRLEPQGPASIILGSPPHVSLLAKDAGLAHPDADRARDPVVDDVAGLHVLDGIAGTTPWEVLDAAGRVTDPRWLEIQAAEGLETLDLPRGSAARARVIARLRRCLVAYQLREVEPYELTALFGEKYL